MILLDTHIWLWWLVGDGALSLSDRTSLDNHADRGQIAISWVSIWEAEMLVRKGRVALLPDLETWVRKATNPRFCTIFPADMDLVLAQTMLPDTFHGDPADRLIVTSALLAEVPLATYDSKIRAASIPDLQIWKS